MSGEPDPEYVRARRVLLDALEALEPHLDSVILVGAQAVYVHAGEADMAVAPFTTDADLALDTDSLAGEPLLEEAMAGAGFARTGDPGAWRSEDDVNIDLMVATAQGGKGRRGARIPPHDKHAARKALGLEGALIDKDRHLVSALEHRDRRSFEIHVAGPAALIVAKSIKIHERRERPDRKSDKDALDVLRLLRAVESRAIAERMLRIESDARASAVVAATLDLLPDLFGTPESLGCEMAVRATAGLEDPAEIAASLAVLAAELMAVIAELRRR